ncbi:cytochrome P450 [Streptosporangium carneum]|uniref:Cytochrome P450 n=1 Tax=Streptosporangium carneum TaxID=47481 RepID=A0A9W6HYE4_9ACTN|nr:cytochrome P450 [Streptosporangium carneum]GLK08625.1 cytochrome P450 [Streptosporangium carneum]
MAKAVAAPATGGLSDLPVAPGRLPLLGHSMSLLRRPFSFLQSLTALGDIVRIDIGTLPVYMLTRPELVHQILVTQARSIKRGILFERVRPLHGNGLTVAEGQAHLRQRRLLQPPLRPSGIGGYVETMHRNTQALADSWHEGQTIDVGQVATDLIMANTTDAMFGTSVEPAAVQTVRAAVPAILDNLMVRTQLPVFLERFPLPVNRRFEAAAHDVRRVVDEVIAHRRGHPAGEGDLIGVLLAARDPETGEPMSDRQIRDEAVGIFINGIATTATTLAWFLHQLARNPGVEERLLAEVKTVCGDGAPLDQAIGRLGYTRRVIQEILRLHPLLMLMRRTTRSLTLGGVEIPAGVELGYSPTALHRDPAVYPEPYRLDPDRWLPERVKPLPAGSFIAFGEGRHRCIGEHFAWAELLVAAAALLPRWKLRHADDHRAEEVREVNAIHPRPDRLSMVVTARTTGR